MNLLALGNGEGAGDEGEPARAADGPDGAVTLDADEVGALYDEFAATFRWGWQKEGHRSVHVGTYRDDEPSPREAAMETVRTLADAAAIDETDRLLNLGCGAGEDSTWLARERGATVVGVDVSDAMLAGARETARESDVTDATTFRRDDFTELATVDDDSVDVVWGLEALCHADDVDGVVERADRALRDDGRVAFADFFARSGDLAATDRRRLGTIDDALSTRFGGIDEVVDALESRGFRDVTVRDGSDAVGPCMTRRYRLSRIGGAIGRLLAPIGVVSETYVAYCRATVAMCRLFERGTLGYYFVTARR